MSVALACRAYEQERTRRAPNTQSTEAAQLLGGSSPAQVGAGWVGGWGAVQRINAGQEKLGGRQDEQGRQGRTGVGDRGMQCAMGACKGSEAELVCVRYGTHAINTQGMEGEAAVCGCHVLQVEPKRASVRPIQSPANGLQSTALFNDVVTAGLTAGQRMETQGELGVRV